VNATLFLLLVLSVGVFGYLGAALFKAEWFG
jgi:K+-transporting ATPase KdpF subunit